MKRGYDHLISRGALVGLIGYVTSGPLGFIVVRLIRPQPAWSTAQTYVENYHIVQDVPFYFGFLLVGGMLMLVAGHCLAYTADNPGRKFQLLLALVCATVFSTLISFNYICQTTFVRHLSLHYEPAYGPSIAAFSMVNPLSLCWAIEMWGYGILGLATLLIANYYRGSSEFIRMLLVSNGIVSLLGIAITTTDIGWVTTTIGLVAYFGWNGLMITLMISIYRHASENTPRNVSR